MVKDGEGQVGELAYYVEKIPDISTLEMRLDEMMAKQATLMLTVMENATMATELQG